MRIALRTSGGRGEYELAGRQAGILNSDLFGLDLRYQLAPDLVIDGRSAAHLVQGKPRIRLDDSRTDHHAYRILAAVLLLPPPRRELRLAAPGADFIRVKQYAISDVDVDVVATSPTSASLRPTKLYLRNSADLVRSVDVAARMAQVNVLWDAARGGPGVLATLVQAHELAAYAGDHSDIEEAATGVRKHLGLDGDILGDLLHRFGVGSDPRPDGISDEAPDDDAEDETDPDDARRQAIVKWRNQTVRTPAGRRFAAEVRLLYGDRCAISGSRLPKLETTPSAGVDAAHILPWAKYDLNSVTNGLCLNKLCHWAFDAGVMRVDYRQDQGRYLVSIPQQVIDDALPADADLGYFSQFVGPIPERQLPRNPALRPSPQYLARLNVEMYG